MEEHSVFNQQCPGYVQINSEMPLGWPIDVTSVIGGLPQFALKLRINKVWKGICDFRCSLIKLLNESIAMNICFYLLSRTYMIGNTWRAKFNKICLVIIL
jgi:hypothetical protein